MSKQTALAPDALAMDRSAEAVLKGSSSGNFPPSSLPWSQILAFTPGTTDLRDYTRELKFLKGIWPDEHLAHVAPRAALQVEGMAFQKIARLDTERLKSRHGVQLLVEALGGTWARLAVEDKFEFFEKAVFQVVQRKDATHESYLARHDAAFEDLMNKKVSIEDVRVRGPILWFVNHN